ncbi:hypothetical protein F8388_017412 [Cannabis sativa]|uniref:Transcription factor TFIIIB component B'' Myb domain-containing protein n=1 Tax=Cannabis sativa TaxID=3483 RepID=A0A7J6H951_CANSA|nr:hypothetical protein F8388_017412 [Cannabis sativa]
MTQPCNSTLSQCCTCIPCTFKGPSVPATLSKPTCNEYIGHWMSIVSGQIWIDYTIIQQIFPNQTREQVNLKFKKEERQHPLRLSDALTNRTKVTTRTHSSSKEDANPNESNWYPREEELEEPTHNANDRNLSRTKQTHSATPSTDPYIAKLMARERAA